MLASSIGLAACAGVPATSPEADILAGPPAEHAVHSQRLEAAMIGLEGIALEALPESLEREQSRTARRAEVIRLADELARTAGELATMVAPSGLSSESRARFEALAGELEGDALALAARARDGTLGTARDERERLLTTCNACHAEARLSPANR